MGVDVQFFEVRSQNGEHVALSRLSMARFVAPEDEGHRNQRRRGIYWPRIESEARQHLEALTEQSELYYTTDDVYPEELDEWIARGLAWRVDETFLTNMRDRYEQLPDE